MTCFGTHLFIGAIHNEVINFATSMTLYVLVFTSFASSLGQLFFLVATFVGGSSFDLSLYWFAHSNFLHSLLCIPAQVTLLRGIA